MPEQKNRIQQDDLALIFIKSSGLCLSSLNLSHEMLLNDKSKCTRSYTTAKYYATAEGMIF